MGRSSKDPVVTMEDTYTRSPSDLPEMELTTPTPAAPVAVEVDDVAVGWLLLLDIAMMNE
jgi:hypothetical protein